MKISLGFSPCPNDTFIFDALVNKKIDTEGITVDAVLEDVETLNKWALAGKLDITKLSFPAFFQSLDKYYRACDLRPHGEHLVQLGFQLVDLVVGGPERTWEHPLQEGCGQRPAEPFIRLEFRIDRCRYEDQAVDQVGIIHRHAGNDRPAEGMTDQVNGPAVFVLVEDRLDLLTLFFQ